MLRSTFARVALFIACAALIGYVVTDEGVLGFLFLLAALLVVLNWAFTGGTPSSPAVRRLRGDPDPGEELSRPASWPWSQWLGYAAGLILFFALIFVGMSVAAGGF